MQVGPLAQVLVGYAGGHEPTKRWADLALETVSSDRQGAGRRRRCCTRRSAATRPARSAPRCISELGQKHWKLLVDNIAKGDTDIFNPPTFPTGELRGFGFHEAPRGTLSHWVVIQDGKIKNYQAVVPTTWNASPRDAKDQKGPYEASLVGNPVADPEAAARGAAHGPLVRSLPGLRGPHARPRGPRARPGEGALACLASA